MGLKNIFRTEQVYASCSEMPLSYFLSVLYQEIKEPKNWEDIFTEYQDLSKEKSNNIFFTLAKEITYNDNKIYIIESSLAMLQRVYNVDLVNILRKYYPSISYSKDTLKQDIKKTLSLLKSLKLKNSDNKSQLKKLQDSAKQTASKKTDWDVQLTVLGKFHGYHIDPEKVTVSRYCALLNTFKEATRDNGRK